MPAKFGTGKRDRNSGFRGEKKILLNKFSKALRPTGVECADNSWPFWSVTSLGSYTSRERRRKCFNGSGPRIWTLLFWQLFNYLQMNGLIGEVLTRGREGEHSVFYSALPFPFWFCLMQRYSSKMASRLNCFKRFTNEKFNHKLVGIFCFMMNKTWS